MSDERMGLPSASGADRLYNCPGSRALERAAPADDPSDEAMEGTAIAEALETESDEGLDESGKNIRQRLSEMEKEAIDNWACEKEIGGVHIIRERRFWIRDRNNLQALSSAKPDVVAHNHGHAIVINHKTGYLDVPQARGNIQSRVEALAVWHDLEGEIVSVRAAIAQFRFKGKFSATDYDKGYLAKAEQEHIFALWKSEQPDAPRVPGYWCRYCKARGFCPEAASFALLPVVTMPETRMAKKDIPAAVATLSIEQLAFLRSRKAMIENILEAVSKRLRTFSDAELAGVGLQLVKSDGQRCFPDIQTLWWIMHKHGVKEEEFREICRVGVEKAQTLMITKLQAANPGLTQKAAKEQADEILAPAVKMAARDPQLRSL